MKKLLTICLTLSIIITNSLSTMAAGIYRNNNSQNNETFTGKSVREFVTNYMEARENMLLTGDKSFLEEVAIAGIMNNEDSHFTLMEKKDIEVLNSEFTIDNIALSDIEVKVELTESISFSGEVSSDSVEHVLRIFATEDGELMVVSDSYYEKATTFKSASYVEEVAETSPNYLVYSTAANSAVGIVNIAEGQVGYLEKASNSSLSSFTANAGSNNYTKYGSWYGLNGQPWCAIFVSWCANQAGVSTSVIPKYAGCTTGMQTFKNWGRFHYSPQYSSTTYTPKVGDIFFTGTSSTSSSHTGIVVAVSSSIITVVDGNCCDKVNRHTYSRTDTSLIGYASPNYCASGHTFPYT